MTFWLFFVGCTWWWLCQRNRIDGVMVSVLAMSEASTIKIQLRELVKYKANIIISLNVTCSCHYIADKLLIWRWATITHLFQRRIVCTQNSISEFITWEVLRLPPWLTEYLCHKWPWICSVCCNHNRILSSIMTELVTREDGCHSHMCSRYYLPFQSTWIHPRFLVMFVLLDI